MLIEDESSDGETNSTEIAPQAEIRATEIVDLDQWIVAVDKVNPENQTADEIDRQVDLAEPEAEFPGLTSGKASKRNWLSASVEGTTLHKNDKPDRFLSGLSPFNRLAAKSPFRQRAEVATSCIGSRSLFGERLSRLSWSINLG